MTTPSLPPSVARPVMAAGAIFRNDTHEILMVRPTYKDHWDIPGGYVEPGESPHAACTREVYEELGLTLPIGRLLVLDWAPADGVGDKLLAVFDGGYLSTEQLSGIALPKDELAEWRFISHDQLPSLTPDRLRLRLETAAVASRQARTIYAEHGTEVDVAS